MDNSGFMPVNFGMNVGNNTVSSSGQILQQLPGVQQIITQNASAKLAGSHNLLPHTNGLPVSTQSAGNQAVLAQAAMQSVINPQAGNQALFGQQQQQFLAQQPGMQQIIGPRGVYAANYQLVPRNYTLINQNVGGPGVTLQLSPQQMGTNLTATLSPLEQQQLVQAATFDPQMHQPPGQQISFQSPGGQLALQSPTPQLTLQSPNNQMTLQSPTQHMTIQNQNPVAVPNQNITHLNAQMIPNGQNGNVIVQGQSAGVIVQGDALLSQNQGQGIFLQGHGFSPNFNHQSINQGQMFGTVPNVAPNILSNQIQGLFTPASIVNNVGSNSVGLVPSSQATVFKAHDNSSQIRPRLEMTPKLTTSTMQNTMSLNPQMQLLAQIANQGLIGINTSQPSQQVLNITSHNASKANLLQQQQCLASLVQQSQSLPSFGHFLLHHHQQQSLPHPFLQNIHTLGMHPTALANMAAQNIQGVTNNLIGAPSFPSAASVGQTVSQAGGATINNTAINLQLSNMQGNSLNADFNNWNIGHFANFVQYKAGSTGNPGVNLQPAHDGQQGAGISPGVPGFPTPQVPVLPKPAVTVSTSNVISTGVVTTLSNMMSRSSITSVTYGLNTISTSKIAPQSTSTCATRPVAVSGQLGSSMLSPPGQGTSEDVKVELRAGDKHIATTSTIVPYGWVRALEGDFIVYYSPTCARLTNMQSIKQYLSTDGTCKCGLECPLLVEKVFDFDTSVISVKWTRVNSSSDHMAAELCSHRHKNVALASLQLGRCVGAGLVGHMDMTALMTSSEMLTLPRVSSTVQQKVYTKKRKATSLSTVTQVLEHADPVLVRSRSASADTSTQLGEEKVSPVSGGDQSGTDSAAAPVVKSRKMSVTERSGVKASSTVAKTVKSMSMDAKSKSVLVGCETSVSVGKREKLVQSEITSSVTSASERVIQTKKTGVKRTSLRQDTVIPEGCDKNLNSIISEACDGSEKSKPVTETGKIATDVKPDQLVSENVRKENVSSSVDTRQTLRSPLVVDVSTGMSSQVESSLPKQSGAISKDNKSFSQKVSSSKAKSPKLTSSSCSNLTSPSRFRSSSSRSSTCSRISSSDLASPGSERSSSRSSEKDTSPRGDYSIHPDTFTQFMNYFGFEPLGSPPLFRQGIAGSSGPVHKMSPFKPLSPLMPGELTSVGMKSSVLANAVNPYSSDLIANMHKIASPPNQQVFPSPLGLPGIPLPNDGHSMYQHGANLGQRTVGQHSSGNPRFLLPGADIGLQMGSVAGLPLGNPLGDFVWLSPNKKSKSKSKKPTKPRLKKEQKKVTDIYESDIPPPNVDVSVLKDKGHGPIPKQKMTSFLENPTEFLKQQTELVNSSISSTCDSPPTIDPESSEAIPHRSESADSDRKTVAKRSESANSDRICSPDKNDEVKVVSDNDVEVDKSTVDVNKETDNEASTVKDNVPNIQLMAQNNRELKVPSVMLDGNCTNASKLHTPTTMVHYTPASLSCHQLSLGKAKQHVQLGNDSKADVARKAGLVHPLQTLFSDPVIGQAFQQMFPQFMQEAFLESIGLGNIGATLLGNQSGTALNQGLNIPGQTNVPSSSGVSTRMANTNSLPAGSRQVPPQTATVSLGSAVHSQSSNFSLQQLLNSKPKADFPASSLLSAAAKAQLLQQNQLNMLIAQQMAGQAGPALPGAHNQTNTGNAVSQASSTMVSPTMQSSATASLPLPLTTAVTSQKLGNLTQEMSTQGMPLSSPDSAALNMKAQEIFNEKPKANKSGSVKISELLSKTDQERMKHKVGVPAPSQDVNTQQAVDMFNIVQHLQQQQQQQMQHMQHMQQGTIHSSPVQNLASPVPNYAQIGLNMNQLLMSQMHGAVNPNISNVGNVQQTGHQQPDGLHSRSDLSNQNMITPQLIHMFNTLGLPVNGHFSQPTLHAGQQLDLSQHSGNAVFLGPLGQLHQQSPYMTSLPSGNGPTPLSMANVNPSIILEGQHVAQSHAANMPGNSSDLNQVVNPSLPLVANVNGNQVLLNMPGVNSVPTGMNNFLPDGRTVVSVQSGMPVPQQLQPTSSAPVMIVQNNENPLVQMNGPNQISITNNDKSSVQQLTFTNQGIDIQNIFQPGLHNNSVANTVHSAGAFTNASQVMPLNLINVQQSFSGNNNLTAMQLQTLQLQQQLLQQIQQVQGMQNLINQCNIQGISGVNSPMPFDKEDSRNNGTTTANLATAVSTAVTLAVSRASPDTSPSSGSPSESALQLALRRAGLIVSSVPTSTTVSSSTSSLGGHTSVSSSTVESVRQEEAKTLCKGNRVIAAADTTADCHTKTVDIGTETDAFEEEEDNDDDHYDRDADDCDSDDVQKDGADVQSRSVGETLSSSEETSRQGRLMTAIKTPVSYFGAPQVNTCLAIATQKGNTKSLKMDTKLQESRSTSGRSQELATEYRKGTSGDLKLRICRKHLLGNTVSSMISKPKKQKLNIETVPESKQKFEKKELRSSTVAATKASTSAAASSSDMDRPTLNSDTCVKEGHSTQEIAKSASKEDAISCSSDDHRRDDYCSERETRKKSELKERMKDEVGVCDSSVKESCSSPSVEVMAADSGNDEERENKQVELTSKIAAALSNQRGRWQLSSQKVSRGKSPSSTDESNYAEVEVKSGEEELDIYQQVDGGGKRNRSSIDSSDTESENDDCELDSSTLMVQYPRSFNTGDLVWGQIRGFPSWPGKLVDTADIKLGQKLEDGKLLVRWFGDHTITQVEPNKLKTLSEGLEAHHRARRKHRKGRKMNTNLEQAIQQAMAELDKQTSEVVVPVERAVVVDSRLHKPLKKKHKK